MFYNARAAVAQLAERSAVSFSLAETERSTVRVRPAAFFLFKIFAHFSENWLTRNNNVSNS